MPMEIYHEYKIDANKLAIGKTKYRWQKMVHNFLVTFVFKNRKRIVSILEYEETFFWRKYN